MPLTQRRDAERQGVGLDQQVRIGDELFELIEGVVVYQGGTAFNTLR